MPLPVIETPKYETKIPSTGKRIQYRPYVVKEEKILMIALESGDQKQIMQAVKDVISACTFDKIDPDLLSVFDLEFLFLRLRAKSVGEVSKVNLKCQKCQKPVTVDINLDQVVVDTSDMPESKIQLTDTIGVNMCWPRVDLIAELSVSENDPNKLAFEIIIGCIESIFDDKREYPAKEHTKDELVRFVESLNQSQFIKLQKFVERMPKLEHTVKYHCVDCKTSQDFTIRGLQNFFSSPSLTTA